jgi:hypothetical protein
MASAGTHPPLDVSHEDDPRVVREAATEDYSLHVVPKTWRSTRGSLSMAWLALFSAMFWLVVAATLSLAVGTVDTLIGMALSVAAYGAINYVLTGYATRSGLTVALFSRAMFGYVGAALATLIFAATAVYYAVFEGSVIAVALHDFFGVLSLKLWYLVVVLYSVPLVFGGVRVWLDRFNGVLLPFYVGGLLVAVIWAIAEHGYSGAWFSYEPESEAAISGPGWWFAFTAYMGVWIMMMYTMDYARFGREADARFNGTFTFGPVFYAATFIVNGLIGIFLANTIIQGALSETSVVLAIVSLMGIVGVGLIWVSQTRINTANFYLASTNMQSFFARAVRLELPRAVWVVATGAIVYLIMLTDVFSFILDALRYQGVFVVGWVAIALAHIVWERRRGHAPEAVEFRPGRVPLINPGGVVAWVVAAAVGIFLLEGGGAFGDTWSAPITAVLAAGIYLASLEVARRTWFVIDRPGDPRDEVDDPWTARVRCHACDKSYIAVEMDRDPTAGHQAICAACATKRPGFYHAALDERMAAPAGTAEAELAEA